jgi:hypothetical protein
MNPEQIAALEKFTEAGAHHNCPFCRSRMITEALPGQRIVLLSGLHKGRSAIVEADPSPIEGEFLIKVDGADARHQWRLSPGRDSFVEAPLEVPSWMLPLSISDVLELENAALRALLRSFGPDARTIRVETAHSLAAVAWQLRLPITGGQLWEMLRAHDFEDAWRSEFCALFEFGVSLLIATHGRRPIKKKVVTSMSS